MKIGSFSIEQEAVSKYQRIEKQSMFIQVQQSPPEMQQVIPEDSLEISDQGLVENEALDEEDFLSEEDKRKIELLEAFITWMTGEKFEFKRAYISRRRNKDENFNPKLRGLKVGQSSARNENSGFGMRIQTKHEVREKEQMTFSSSGKVQTEDGKSIEFDLKLHMSRETYEYNEFNMQIGNFHDPLVMNFDGKGADFSDKKLQIDINLDGQLDEINFLSQGSGFLALDKNNNKEIDDGTELFGPQTNKGFDELRVYDSDQNHWIDENDPIFESLKIWTLNDQGEATLIGLADADVGAIYLGDVGSRYTIKHGDEDMARIARSSIYLTESGQANTIHEIDLKL